LTSDKGRASIVNVVLVAFPLVAGNVGIVVGGVIADVALMYFDPGVAVHVTFEGALNVEDLEG